VSVLHIQEELQAASSSSSSSSVAAAGNVCYRYAIVRDVEARTDIDICSSTQRISHAYTSVGSSLQIRLFRLRLPVNQTSSAHSTPPAADAGPFLIHYTGTLCASIMHQLHRYSLSVFTQKQVFGPRTAKSLPIWIKFCTHLLLYGIHFWADLDHDRLVGGSRPK